MIKYKIVFTDDITKENIFLIHYLKQVNLLIKQLIIKENLQKIIIKDIAEKAEK